MKSDEVFGIKEDSRTYSSEIQCANCKEKFLKFNIPFGEEVDDYFYNERCKKCGCYMIKAKRGRPRRSNKKE